MKTRLTELATSLFKGDTIKHNKQELLIHSIKRKFHAGQAVDLTMLVERKTDGFVSEITITPTNVHEYV